jgi:hypothetical protein
VAQRAKAGDRREDARAAGVLIGSRFTLSAESASRCSPKTTSCLKVRHFRPAPTPAASSAREAVRVGRSCRWV